MSREGGCLRQGLAPLLVASLALAAFASRVSAGPTGPIFDSPHFPIDIPGGDFAIADLNGDGKDDCVAILAKSVSTPTIGAYLNRGRRSFELVAETSVGDAPEHVECVELDGDGRPDLVVMGAFGVKALLGDGNGRFRSETALVAGPARFATGDLNRDRLADLVVQQGSRLLVFLARRGGGFTAPSERNSAPGIPLVADFDRDGAVDVVVVPTAAFEESQVVLYPGDGHGGFEPQRASFYPSNDGALDAVVCHATPDEFPDIVLRFRRLSGYVGMLQNRGNRTFVFGLGTPCVREEPGEEMMGASRAENGRPRLEPQQEAEGITCIGAADVDGDGRIELLSTYLYARVDVHTTIAFSDGRCTRVDQIATDRVAVGDLDADGRLDLIGGEGSLLVVLPGDGSLGFGRGHRSRTSQWSSGGAVADFDGDGLLDVAWDDFASVSTSKGLRDGSFEPPGGAFEQEIPIDERFIAADLNQDRLADLVTDRGGIWLGNGDGSFQETGSLPDAGFGVHLAAADLNSDGRMDIVVSGEPTAAYLGGGDGTFERSWSSDAVRGRCVVADADGDGRPDLFVGGSYARGVGDGTFEEPTPTGGSSVSAVGDLSGDRIPDLVTAQGEILRGLGNGRWSAWTHLPAPHPLGDGWPVELGDFDGDGDLDVAADDSQVHSIVIFLNDSRGGLLFAGEYGAGLWFRGFQTLEGADVTGDGKLDLIAIAAGDPRGMPGTITTLVNVFNRPPDVTAATARLQQNGVRSHDFAMVLLAGVVDPEGDAFTVEVTGVEQDEPVLGSGSGNTCPDAIVQQGRAAVRLERSGLGNGRVYEIRFVARDALGNESEGSVEVCVPHDPKRKSCIDDGRRYSSLACRRAPMAETEDESMPASADLRVLSAASDGVHFGVSMPGKGAGDVTVFDIAGRRLAKLDFACEGPCERELVWGRGGSAPGVYFARMRTEWGVHTRTVVVTNR